MGIIESQTIANKFEFDIDIAKHNKTPDIFFSTESRCPHIKHIADRLHSFF